MDTDTANCTKHKLPTNIFRRLKQQIKYKYNHQDHNDEKYKTKTWTTFTYYSLVKNKITKVFKNTEVGMAVESTNTLQHFTKAIIKDYKHEYKKVHLVGSII